MQNFGTIVEHLYIMYTIQVNVSVNKQTFQNIIFKKCVVNTNQYFDEKLNCIIHKKALKSG